MVAPSLRRRHDAKVEIATTGKKGCNHEQHDNKHHSLEDILILTVCAFICNANTWTDTEPFGRAKYNWLKNFLALPNGIPSHDTLGRVFSRLDPASFRACFIRWMESVAQVTQGEVVAIDGKTLRRSHDQANGKSAIHMVSAWAATNSVVLGQTKTQEKSNEITAIPELLQLLAVDGCIVTIDAITRPRRLSWDL